MNFNLLGSETINKSDESAQIEFYKNLINDQKSLIGKLEMSTAEQPKVDLSHLKEAYQQLHYLYMSLKKDSHSMYSSLHQKYIQALDSNQNQQKPKNDINNL